MGEIVDFMFDVLFEAEQCALYTESLDQFGKTRVKQLYLVIGRGPVIDLAHLELGDQVQAGAIIGAKSNWIVDVHKTLELLTRVP